MRPSPTRRELSGGSALLVAPAAAVLVHQLRYTLAYGSRSGAQLVAQGHSYLHSLVPWTILGLGVALSLFLRRAAHALATGDSGRSPRLSALVLWPAATGGLVAIYAVQELLEGLLATGHPGGINGVFGHGGWWSVPAAAAVAALVVALLRVARVALRLAARAHRRSTTRARTALRPRAVELFLLAPLACAAAGRAPPLARRPG